MDLPSAIVARLGPGSATHALVGTRAFWRVRPQSGPGGALPVVVLDVISERRPQHLDGFDDMREARVQAAAMASAYEASRELAEALVADLAGTAVVADASGADVLFWAGDVDGPRDLGEQTEANGFVHRAVVDLLLRFSVQT